MSAEPASKKSIILTGPTAVGKSSLAIDFALEYKRQTQHTLEIINADSVCFYQEFNIGSAKPNALELKSVPHHLIDIAHPNQNYHAGDFLRDCTRILDEIHSRGNRALIVGGSGFYLKALRLGLWDAPATSPELREKLSKEELPVLFERLKAIDPIHAEKIGGNDRYRIIRALEIFELSGKIPSALESAMPTEPNPNFELWTIDRDKEELAARMKPRIQAMLDAGLLDEVKQLQKNYPESRTLHAVGYQQVLNYFEGVTPEGRKVKPGLEGLMNEIELAHRQLAKQQRTWFKSLEPNHTFVLDRDIAEITAKLMKFYQ